jgi:lipoprotein-anchoring transpeptidase ErfK/SrfK
MYRRTGGLRNEASPQWIGRVLAAVFGASAMGVALALVTSVALALATPVALADPGADPPPGVVAAADPSLPTADVPVPPPLPPRPADPTAVDAVGPPPSTQSVQPVAGQDPTPFTGESPFRPPSFDPPNGATVGVAKPIVINFAVPIGDRALAQSAVHIASNPPVPGHFYWMNDSQLRWRPENFWPAHATVGIDAGGTKSSFSTGDALVATIDNNTHQMVVTRNGNPEKTIPISMGKPKDETPNGTYYVIEKFPKIVMDSSTYGVPVNSPEGYKVNVYDATRITNTGIFVHAAPWSLADQGKRNVSHGCINVSPENAKWFMATFNRGDPVVVKNSVGTYNQNDGYDDWQR